MDVELRNELKPGARVTVTQQIPARDYAWSTAVVGTVIDFRQKQTGSWFAHAKNDKLWLDRLVIRKDDGEVTTLNLDVYSHVDVESAPTVAEQSASETKNESNLPV
jgi:hypothetical protein